MLTRLFARLCRIGWLKKRLWRSWYEYLAGRHKVTAWTCMNYGYTGSPEPRTLVLTPEQESERWCLQLYHFVASGVEIAGREVLEVGSGRGGGAAFVRQHLQPACLTGVDFSGQAVALCRERYPLAGLNFLQGDAEALPCEAASFDAVINVESSHCYGNFPQFLHEVHRVLRPGGAFLYADFRDANFLETWREQLRTSGLILRHETDITPNVLAALDADDARKRTLIQQLIPRWLLKSFQDFAGTKGSIVHREFATGGMRYFSFVLKKPNDTTSR